MKKNFRVKPEVIERLSGNSRQEAGDADRGAPKSEFKRKTFREKAGQFFRKAAKVVSKVTRAVNDIAKVATAIIAPVMAIQKVVSTLMGFFSKTQGARA